MRKGGYVYNLWQSLLTEYQMIRIRKDTHLNRNLLLLLLLKANKNKLNKKSKQPSFPVAIATNPMPKQAPCCTTSETPALRSESRKYCSKKRKRERT